MIRAIHVTQRGCQHARTPHPYHAGMQNMCPVREYKGPTHVRSFSYRRSQVKPTKGMLLLPQHTVHGTWAANAFGLYHDENTIDLLLRRRYLAPQYFARPRNTFLTGTLHHQSTVSTAAFIGGVPAKKMTHTHTPTRAFPPHYS